MGSRAKEPKTPHQPLLSSLVVRPSETGGCAGVGAAVSDYEPGEVRRDPHRNARYDDHGYRMRLSSISPVRRRDTRHRYSPGIEHSGGAWRSRGFGSGIDAGRYGESSPPYGHWKDGVRFAGRGYGGPRHVPGPFRTEGPSRNNPNVQPREGDWICSDPLCKNLNFARRDFCNNCNRPRYIPARSPRRGYPGPPLPPRHRFPCPPSNHSPGRPMNESHRSPYGGWQRYSPREIRAGRPPPRHDGRFHDPLLLSDGQDFPDDDYRDRHRYDKSMPLDWSHRDRGGENLFNEKRGYGGRDVSPPPHLLEPPHQRDLGNYVRERSRSPVRVGEPSKDFHSDVYMSRIRDDRRGAVPQGF